MKQRTRRRRRTLARVGAEPTFYFVPLGTDGTASGKFVGALRCVADMHSGGVASQRVRPLGSEYVPEALHAGCFLGLPTPKGRGPPVEHGLTSLRGQIVDVRACADDRDMASEMLFWWDAFYVVALFDFDTRSGSLLAHETSFRQVVLADLRLCPECAKPRDFPPHFLDVAVQSTAHSTVSGGES